MRRIWVSRVLAASLTFTGLWGMSAVLPGVTHADTGQLEISTAPALYPLFDPAVSDYVTRCTDAAVHVSVSAPADTTVVVDSQTPRGGTFATDVLLGANQSFTVTATIAGAVTGTYYVRCLPSDFWTWTAQRFAQPQAEWYMVNPGGALLPGQSGNYVAIFDTNGVPVWWMRAASRAGAVLLLPNGNVGWSQNPPTTAGAEERRLDGRLVRTINTVAAAADFHEFLLLPNGNYLLGANVIRSGYSLCGQSNLTILDTGIQEVAPDGSLVWSWYPSDHIALSEIPAEWCGSILANGSNSGTYDPYHFNSAEPNGDSIVLSFRHMDAVYRVSKATGDVEWKIGGTPILQSLATVNDPGNGPWGGHDARVLSDGTVSVHDNGFHPAVKRTPRAGRYQIDLTARTATLLEQVNDPGTVTAGCCGMVRRMAGGNWAISWGGNPLVTELTSSGSRVFSLAFRGGVSSYRAHPVPPGVLSRSALRTGMDAQHPRYARPGGATPLRVPLVPEFTSCGAPDVSHASPLDSPSCSSPALESPMLTTSSQGRGWAAARFDVVVGNPMTVADEADVAVSATIGDVTNEADGSDYVGPLVLASDVRVTDTANGPSATTPATVQDARFAIPISCVATQQPDPQIPNKLGGNCNVSTTFDTLVPGFAREGARAVISTPSVVVEDAGADGMVDSGSGCPPTCGTGDEAVFLRQGVFAP